GRGAWKRSPPRVWRLGDMAEVIRVPSTVQPMRYRVPRFGSPQYVAPSWSSSPPSPPVGAEMVLFGVGLYPARPALTMLDPGNPRAHTPRGSFDFSPARSSATMTVFEVPSVISRSLAP